MFKYEYIGVESVIDIPEDMTPEETELLKMKVREELNKRHEQWFERMTRRLFKGDEAPKKVFAKTPTGILNIV
jgi:hypothetical protein